MTSERRDELELLGSQESARAMRIELARLLSAVPALDRPKPTSLGPHRIGVPAEPGLVDLLLTHARTPSRLFWNWARVTGTRLEALDRGLRSVLRDPPLDGRRSFTVQVRSKGRVEAGPLQIRGLVRRVVESAWGWALDPEQPDVVIAVRGAADGLWVGADLGGDLTGRGYRPPNQLAPIRENLAAQMVALSGWFPDREPLVDPFAGSGTLLAEAHGWARGAPARSRGPAWIAHVERGELFPDTRPRMLALEDDARQRRGLEATLGERAIRVELDDFRRTDPQILTEELGPGPGLILTNPPYGVRIELEPEELTDLYRDLAAWWRGFGPGWRIGLIGFPESVEPVFGPRPKMKKPMRNGDLRTSFFVYVEPSGPSRLG